MSFAIICLATFMAVWLIGCLIPGWPPHWRIALLTIPVVAFALLSVPPHYSRFILALAVGAVVMLMGKLAERFLGHTPDTLDVPVVRKVRARRRLRQPRGKRYTPDGDTPRKRSDIPPL